MKEIKKILTREELLADGFYPYDLLHPSEEYDGKQFLCICDGRGEEKPYLFYECRVWSEAGGFFFDEWECQGLVPAPVLYFKPLAELGMD